MRNRGDAEFYRSLSRKELQSLCKRYGLLANRSSSDMAESLASYFENKILSSLTLRGGLSGIQKASLPTFLVPPLQPGAPLNSTGNSRRDCYEPISCTREEGTGGNLDGSSFNNKEIPTRKNYLGFARDGRVNDRPKIQHIDVNDGACPKENSYLKSSTATCSSSFKFYTSSDEGINLCVDLNSNPSDWVEKLKNEVSICDIMHPNKSRSFHEDIGLFGESNKQVKNSFLWNLDAGKGKDGHLLKESSPSVMKEKNRSLSDHLDGGEGSLMSSAIKPSDRVMDALENYEEDHGLNSSIDSFTAPDQIVSRNEPCSKNVCMITLDPDVNSLRKKLAGDSVVNISDGPKIRNTLEHQNTKLSNEICENSSLQNNCKPVNSAITPSDRVMDALENYKEDRRLSSSIHNFTAPDQVVSCNESCSKDVCTITLDSDVNYLRKKSAGDSVVNIADGPKILNASEHQDTKFSNEICENSFLLNNCKLVNSISVIPRCPEGGYVDVSSSEVEIHRKYASCSPCKNVESAILVGPKHSVQPVEAEKKGLTNLSEVEIHRKYGLANSSEVEIHRKYASCSPCKNVESANLVGPKHSVEYVDIEQNGLANSTEFDHESCGSHLPSCVEEQEKGKIINGREYSGCDSFEKTCVRLDGVKSNEEFWRKRTHIDAEDQNGCGKPEAKILRSTKHLSVNVRPRRSMRLVSK